MDTAGRLIWSELGDAKNKELYITKLITSKRSLVKKYTIFALIFSTSGVFGWSIWTPYPIVVCAGLSFMSILNLIQPHILPNDRELAAYNEFSTFYCDYFRKLEKLWIQYSEERIDSEKALQEFYSIKETESTINNKVNEVHLQTIRKLSDEASVEAIQYLNKIHIYEQE